MKGNFISIIFLLYLFSKSTSKNLREQNNNEVNEDKLIFVWEHFRHGARGPYIAVDPKTNLDFIGEKWDGTGEITPLGMRMLYLLGISNKKKYSKFLSQSFNPNELFIISTNVNRTITSVDSFLKGFYNNKTSINMSQTQIERSNILNSNYSDKINLKIKELENKSLENGENTIPVHIFDREKLEFGLYDLSNCPGIDIYKKKNQNSEKVKNIYEEIIRHTNETFGQYIFDFMKVSDPLYLWNKTNNYYLADTFFSDYFDNREMKNIRETHIDMEAFYHNSLNVTYIDTYYSEFGIPSTETVYITASPILRNLLNYIYLRIDLDKNGKTDDIIPNSPRFVILSGHDTSLAPIDIFMESEFGVEFKMATYASSQTFELWKNGTTGKYSIHYLFNQEEKGVYDFDTFKNKLEAKLYTQDQIKKICYPNNG